MCIGLFKTKDELIDDDDAGGELSEHKELAGSDMPDGGRHD